MMDRIDTGSVFDDVVCSLRSERGGFFAEKTDEMVKVEINVSGGAVERGVDVESSCLQKVVQELHDEMAAGWRFASRWKRKPQV